MAKNPSNGNHKNFTISAGNFEEFVENIKTDEMRSGFLVDSHRKKLWNVQIGLINEFARICAKYNLRWFAYGGTLLGAARHKGFIPWDDDVDLAMLRPDYEKFRQIMREEIKSPYFVDDWSDYRLEEDAQTSPEYANLPLITREDKKENIGYWPFIPLIKIRDSRTSMVEVPERKNTHQGIWIDIFPLDPVPPFETEKQISIFAAAGELLAATIYPEDVSNAISNAVAEGQELFFDSELLKKFAAKSYKEKAMFFDKFMAEHFFSSPYVGQTRLHTVTPLPRRYRTKHFVGDIVYLPFEKIQVPAPATYAENLEDLYGDWRTPSRQVSHSQNWSADIPYNLYLEYVKAY